MPSFQPVASASRGSPSATGQSRLFAEPSYAPGPFEFYLNENLIFYTSAANPLITNDGVNVEVLILRLGSDAMKCHSEPGSPTPPDKDSTTDLNNSHSQELYPKVTPDRLDQVIPRYWVYDWKNDANVLNASIIGTKFNVVEVDIDPDLIKKYFNDFGLNTVRVRNKSLVTTIEPPSDTPEAFMDAPTSTRTQSAIIAAWRAGGGNDTNTVYLAWGADPPHVYNGNTLSILSAIGVTSGSWTPPGASGWNSVLDQIFYNPTNPSVWVPDAAANLRDYVIRIGYASVCITNEFGGLAGIYYCYIYHFPGGSVTSRIPEFNCALMAEFFDRGNLRSVVSSWRYPPESANTLLVNDKPLFFGLTLGD